MAKKGRRKGGSEAAAAAEDAAVATPEDSKFEEALKGFDHLVQIRLRIRRKIESFKRQARITPNSIRRLMVDILGELD